MLTIKTPFVHWAKDEEEFSDFQTSLENLTDTDEILYEEMGWHECGGHKAIFYLPGEEEQVAKMRKSVT